MGKVAMIEFNDRKPELSPECQDLVDKIIALLRERDLTFKEAMTTLDNVSAEIGYLVFVSMRL